MFSQLWSTGIGEGWNWMSPRHFICNHKKPNQPNELVISVHPFPKARDEVILAEWRIWEHTMTILYCVQVSFCRNQDPSEGLFQNWYIFVSAAIHSHKVTLLGSPYCLNSSWSCFNKFPQRFWSILWCRYRKFHLLSQLTSCTVRQGPHVQNSMWSSSWNLKHVPI